MCKGKKRRREEVSTLDSSLRYLQALLTNLPAALVLVRTRDAKARSRGQLGGHLTEAILDRDRGSLLIVLMIILVLSSAGDVAIDYFEKGQSSE